METKRITLEALIEANNKKVWEYYTTPEHITHWNFASDDWQCPSASNDLKIGGKYSARMEATDGSMGFDFEGIYNAVDEHEKLDFTLEDGRNVTVVFEPSKDQTRVSINFDADAQNPIEMQRDG